MKHTQMEPGEDKSNFLALDQTFQSDYTGLYHLLLHWTQENLRCLILDSSTDVVLGSGIFSPRESESGEQFLDRVFQEQRILQKEYKEVMISLSGRASCLIPNPLYDPENAKKVLAFSCGNPVEQVREYKHPKLSAVLLMDEGHELEVIKQRHPNSKFYPNPSMVIETLLKHNKFDKRNMLYIEVLPEHCEMYYLADGRFKWYNLIEAANENDFVYHVLNTLQHFDESPENTEVFLSGDIYPEDPKFKLLAKYVEKLHWSFELKEPFLSLEQNSSSKHQFSSLYNLYGCAL